MLLSNLITLRATLPPLLQLQHTTQKATASTVRSLGPILSLNTLFKHSLTSDYLTEGASMKRETEKLLTEQISQG